MATNTSSEFAIDQGKEFLQWNIPSPPPLSFLAGAGISIPQPSGLPSGGQLIHALLETTVAEDALEALMELANIERTTDWRNDNDFIRFERLLQEIYEWIDPNLRSLDVICSADNPNRLHFILARQLTDGNLVFTTNFDSLIENALMDIGSDFSVAATEEDFSSVHWKASSSERGDIKSLQQTLFKLHGSCRNREGQDMKHSLRATLNKLSLGNGFMLLDEDRLGVLSHALCRTHLVVLGYSGFDDFDIIPSIIQIKERQRILWVDHKSAGQPSVLTGQEISELANTSNLDEQVGHTEARLYKILDHIQRAGGEGVMLIRGHSEFILSQLLGRKTTDGDFVQSPNSLPQSPLVPMDLVIDKRLKYFLAGRLFDEMQRYDTALRYYERYSDEIGRFETAKQGVALLHIARMQSILGFHTSAAMNIQRCIDALKQVQDSRHLGRAYIKLATLNHWIGHTPENPPVPQTSLQDLIDFIERAMHFYKQAIICGLASQDMATVAQAHHQMGFFLHETGKYDDALKNYSDALEIRRSLGDFVGIASTLNNMATTFSTKHKPLEAINRLEEAIEVFDTLGFDYEKIRPLITLCTLHTTLGRDKASVQSMLLEILNKAHVDLRLSEDVRMALNDCGLRKGKDKKWAIVSDL